MILKPLEIKDKTGRTIVLRNAEVSDAGDLIDFMKAIACETPYLIREPGEFTMTIEQEEAFIESCINNPKALMLIASIDGVQIGNGSLMNMGQYRRYSHRCEIAIALYQKYCGAGIGKGMLEAILSAAKEIGYEQAELEVVCDNHNAVRLYRKLGFEVYGTFPDNMKYSDGTYADAFWMMKKL